ncbi:MAG: cysteine synthase A [Bacteroidetes bacterium HGW-Bacteroidetes-21]|jgi:cysteine synthase A|nr:MAG: cysteine synthase A [Bacteroidetes bacterium HGW-Bacteroidetes-21]
MNIASNIAELVGNTPVARLTKISANCYASVFAKLESFNPGGSVKDRLAFAMISDAELKGLINADTQIIEPTSGNTGISLALICAIKGYRLMVTMPENMSTERISLMRMYGAEVVLTPAALGMKGAIEKAENLASYYPNSYIPYQFKNLANVRMHYSTTGPEIWNAFEGNIQMFVAGVGTGGTISGVGKFLKEKNPEIKIYALEPADSPVLSGGQAGSHRIQGIGAGFIPPVYNPEVVDQVITVQFQDAFDTALKLASEEGILCGISSGANVWAALQLAKNFDNVGKNIVTLICDTGERYLSNLSK